MAEVKQFVFNEFQENTFLVWDQTLACAIIDPGCMYPHEREQLKDFISAKGLKPVLLLNTHCHIDHVLGNEFVMQTYQLPLHLHKEEVSTYKDTRRWTAMFGLPDLNVPENLVFIDEGQSLSFGNTHFEVILTPGHSVASLSFYIKEEAQLFSGDVLFKQSIGRTDLPGGNTELLLQTIKNKLFHLPDETIVYPGHFETTSIGSEKINNPFIR